MNTGHKTKTLVILGTLLLGTGVAVGVGIAPGVRPAPATEAAAQPGPAVARAAEQRTGVAGRATSVEDQSRLAVAAAALSRVPQLQAPPQHLPVPGQAPSPRRRLAQEELPAAVQQTVAALTSGRKVQKPTFEARERDGQRYFKAEFLLDGVEHEYALDEQGKVRFSEVDMEPSQLPTPVASGIQAALPGALLLEAERDQMDDKPPFYEVEIRHQGQQMELHVAEDGRILEKRVR